jgi:hypothetical protein
MAPGLIAPKLISARLDARARPPQNPFVDSETRPSLIMIQFLDWVAARPRTREDVLDAWRSSCPRMPVWEDARADGYVRQFDGEKGEHRVELTARGRAVLAADT